jgi:hypothetical protein
MCLSDPQPSYVDLAPVSLAPVSSPSPSITELEARALGAVDLAEKISEPLNRFSLARGAVRVVALIARARRDRLLGGAR